MIKKLLAYLLFYIGVNNCFSQDVHFSQFYNTPQLINPALIGDGTMKGRLIFNYRNQGNFTANPYKTIAFAGDAKLRNKNFSSGLLFIRDKSGDGNFSTTNICLSGASNVQLNKDHSLKLGIQAGWTQFATDIQNLTWNSQFDGTKINPDNPSGENLKKSFGYFDLSAGIVWKYIMTNKNEIRAGVSAYHLTHPAYNAFSTKSVDTRWNGYLDANILIKNTSIRILPSLLYMKQRNANELTLGTSVKYKIGMNQRSTPDRIASFAYLGAYYRMQDAMIILAGLSFQEQMVVCFSYDITTSQLSPASKQGGIEFSVHYFIPN